MTSARIMIVDDDPQIRRVLRTALVAQGYEAVDARNGEEALEKLRNEKLDLMILDVNMPGMNGLETCRTVRSSSDISIIMLTVRDAEADKVEALDAGADDYMTKPFSSPELLARIRAALRRSPQLATDTQVVTFDDVEINFNQRRVTVGTREARLTPKEFELLQYMVAHPNVPITHTKLLQSVWGPDYGDEVEYLRVFINQLRKKLEKNPSTPKYLVTEPWVGYRFCLPQ
jgi:two-component system, OmpR family, KDP operon response regulator KdpE